ncbi:polygalacturonase-like [Tripterygium wilfordii]|uniref:polygalacturonase-like n=1 Tax=Tripterygium wilfordii TaxID=458696 RepID=UPI0018F853AE|nr:polygalacturonase-like [Tripterygium wilfordii]
MGHFVTLILCLILSLFALGSSSGFYTEDPIYKTHGGVIGASRRSISPRPFNVDDFGAKGDGIGDDTKAFKKAWEAACSSKAISPVIVVPKSKTYHLNPITFSGPCNSNLVLAIFGTIQASTERSNYAKDGKHWIKFENVQNFRVKGGGIINGNGKIWWENSCKVDERLPCTLAPTAMTFIGCKNLIVANLWFKNAQKMHVSFQDSENVQVLNLLVTAPGNSPNTDGIHVTNTQNIRIQNCDIRTGDDCISIVSGSKNVEATDITCGPGHGISIGSLGANNSQANVTGVTVNRARLSGTTNGLRIKTWQGGSGYANNIIFQNVVMNNVSNPIIVDQNYCDKKQPCQQKVSAVQVSNIVYSNIRGSSASAVATNFDCSRQFPCKGIMLQDINLVSEERGLESKASCVNVKFTRKGHVSPQCSKY